MPVIIKSQQPGGALSTMLPLHIKEYHLRRGKQVLALNVQAGRFPATGFSTFIGSGPAGAPPPPPPPGAAMKPPRGTTRRDLWTLQPKYIPFPGRIYFENPTSADFQAAVNLFLNYFNQTALRGTASERQKGFKARYAKSLVSIINNRMVSNADALLMLKSPFLAKTGIVVEFVNISPHAATLEVDWRIMFDSAVAVAEAFSPGITVTYDYINSDQLDLKYGRGSGGPGPARAAATSRGYPVTYALPRVQIALNAQQFGVSNVRFVLPGRKVSYRVRKKLRGRERIRT